MEDIISSLFTNLTPAQSNWFTPYKEYVAVGISLIPVIGEAYDGWTIYAQKDPITGEPLTLIGNAFTIIGEGRRSEEVVI